MTPPSLILRESNFDPKETINRLAEAAASTGMAILARIDHAAAAAQVGMKLRPTEVLIFGSPKAGTPIMQDMQTAAIDLPLKALAWQDAEGTTWIGYTDPMWIGEHHGVVDDTKLLLRTMAEKLSKMIAIVSGDAWAS